MTRPRHIVIVDDEPNIGSSLKLILEGERHRVTVCVTAGAFEAHWRRQRADLFVIDVRLPDGNGLELLRTIRASDTWVPVIMISGHATIADAVEATRIGALDFLEKPLSRDRVLLAVRNALDRSDLQRENERFREMVGDAPVMVGASEVFRRVVEQATLVARSDANVLLIGESGTGKELLAAHIHAHSPWAAGPFVKVNCAAIPADLIESELFGHEKGAFSGAGALRRGRFELADGGTILLDEVGDLQEAAQAKLLRILQDGEVHRLGSERGFHVSVRVVAATNRHLEQLIAERRFREDLYYRLGGVPLRVPALRERPDDVPDLVRHVLRDYCARNNVRAVGISPEAISRLARYAWPGNVRELRNVVERMAILCRGDVIDVEVLPPEIRNDRVLRARGLQDIRASAERDRITAALEEADWNVARAARVLGIERTHLHKRLRALGISRP